MGFRLRWVDATVERQVLRLCLGSSGEAPERLHLVLNHLPTWWAAAVAGLCDSVASSGDHGDLGHLNWLRPDRTQLITA